MAQASNCNFKATGVHHSTKNTIPGGCSHHCSEYSRKRWTKRRVKIIHTSNQSRNCWDTILGQASSHPLICGFLGQSLIPSPFNVKDSELDRRAEPNKSPIHNVQLTLTDVPIVHWNHRIAVIIVYQAYNHHQKQKQNKQHCPIEGKSKSASNIIVHQIE